MDLHALPPELEQFVQHQVHSGRYPSTTEVVCQALRLLKEKERRDALRKDIQAGIDQLERGEYIELTSEAELRAFFNDIEARGIASSEARTDSL